MALTNDDKREILELYGRGYSGRKIATKTGHSEVTVYKVIRLAKERIINVIEKGWRADQISSQLDYPESFVNRVIAESNVEHKEEEKDELEAEDTLEEIESSNELDVKVDWDDFQKDLEFEQRKDLIREKTNKFMKSLKLWEEHLGKRIVLDVEWGRRQKARESELANFVLDRLDDIDTLEILSDLESISEEIFGNINTLINEYKVKADQAEKAHIAQEKARQQAYSDELLGSKINIPMFPDFVKDEVKKRFLVSSLWEASIVHDALAQMALDIIQANDFKLKQDDETWQGFMSIIKEGGWNYL